MNRTDWALLALIVGVWGGLMWMQGGYVSEPAEYRGAHGVIDTSTDGGAR